MSQGKCCSPLHTQAGRKIKPASKYLVGTLFKVLLKKKKKKKLHHRAKINSYRHKIHKVADHTVWKADSPSSVRKPSPYKIH